MSGEFIAALDPASFKAVLSADKQTYTCSCGLGIAAQNADFQPLQPALLRAAHGRHHAAHFGVVATLYLIGGVTPAGRETIAIAQCSCDYDKEHPSA